MMVKQSYEDSKQKSYKIIQMQLFASLENAKADIENARLNSAAVKLVTVQVTGLPLWLQLLKIQRDLLFSHQTDTGLVRVYYV
jgi:hypothetical protein